MTPIKATVSKRLSLVLIYRPQRGWKAELMIHSGQFTDKGVTFQLYVRHTVGQGKSASQRPTS